VPSYEYAVKVYPWGQKLGHNVRGKVWVPVPDEMLAEQKVYDDLFDIYHYSPDLDRLHNLTVNLIEEAEIESEVR
jgi:hypothetical protein